jgi:hypothetical protein
MARINARLFAALFFTMFMLVMWTLLVVFGMLAWGWTTNAVAEFIPLLIGASVLLGLFVGYTVGE